MRALASMLAATVVVAATASAAQAAPALSRAERAQIGRTIDGFVLHAVRHRDAAAAYGLVSPTIRAGLSRGEWARHDPVYPFPARGRHFPWTVQYVQPAEIGGTLMLQPRKGTKVGPIIFDLRLTKHNGRWLVDSLIPAATIGPNAGPDKVRSVRDFSPQASGDSAATGPSRVGADYIVIPFALFGVVLAALVGWFLLARRRDRRIAREYLASRPRPSIRRDDARAGSPHQP